MSELIAELVAKITADASELKKALAESEKGIQKTGKAMEKETKSWQEQFKAVGKIALGMGATITGAMTMVIKSFTKTGSELHDLALKTGVSVEALAGLKYAAEQNGASLATVDSAIRRMSTTMMDAKDGLAETQRAFDRMGLSLEELEGLNPEQQFMKIASAIAEIPDPMTRAATAQDLFGRSGMDMLPMLSQGAEGLRKMMEEGQKYSGWTQAAANLADDFGDSLGTLKISLSGVFVAIGSELLPVLKDFIKDITVVIKDIADWAKAHPELTRQIGLVALALGGFLILAGIFMMIAPAIAAAWAIAMGPVGWIILAIAALTGVSTYLWLNWKTGAEGAAEATDTLTNSTGVLANSHTKAVAAIMADIKATMGLTTAYGNLTRSQMEAIVASDKLSFAMNQNMAIAQQAEWAINKALGFAGPWGGGTTGGGYAGPAGYESPEAAAAREARLFAANPLPSSMISFQHGGIVPGPEGKAVPVLAHGGETIIPSSKAVPVLAHGGEFSGVNIIRQIHEGIPNFQYGGIIPGPLGKPVPIIAHGGEEFLGDKELARGDINIYVAGDVISEGDFIKKVRRALIKDGQRNYSAGIP